MDYFYRIIFLKYINKNFKGIIIEESLANIDILKGVNITENQAEEFANQLSKSLDQEHVWYADFKNEIFHYIIFRDKVFKVDRTKKSQYDEVAKYGISLGIPAQQLDYSSQVK
ncbi:MAG: hypothetical protein KAI57_04300 [Candidatus Pacebacteria bacterium]|nr:hypothetical protein [Candidatus Paceibacterota bacterium]